MISRIFPSIRKRATKQAQGRLMRFIGQCRGTVAIMFAVSLLPIVIGTGAAIDMSRLTSARAAMQRAVDNAALSGAAAYTLNATAYNTLALTMATSSFCDAAIGAPGLPAGFSVVATTVANSMTQETCGTSAGPNVSAVTGGYQTGIPATYSNIGSYGCTATNNVITGTTCGFIVTVTASAQMNSLFPVVFGTTKKIQVTGFAANPFINLPNAIKAQILGSAYNVNTVWVYPLLLDASGNPDFTTNAGALPNYGCTSSVTCSDVSPGVSGCTDNPLQFACGNYVMLADTNYASCTSVCTPSGGSPAGTQFLNGVVQNPQAPTAVITATTPIGIAFESIAGGARGYNDAITAMNPKNGCVIERAVYTTASQIYSNSTDDNSITVSPTPTPALDWHLVTHWFYSSYLANNLPPSYGEILSQYTTNPNLIYPSEGVGQSNNTFSPTMTTCTAATGNTQSNLTTYPGTVSTASSAADNRSLFILNQPAGSSYILPANTSDAYKSYTPSGTPGYQYAALSCQAYGNNVFTFYWNDMGGSVSYGDDLDYNNGSVRITCTGPSFVVLIG